MSASSPSLTSGSDTRPFSRTSLWLVCILVLAALIMGTQTVTRAYSVAQTKWLFSDARHTVVVAATLGSALLTCCLFLTAAWLLFSSRHPISDKSHLLANIVIFAAVYGPFCWAIASSWRFLFPVLPGFVAGVFTKPMDNNIIFVTVSCLDTALIFLSLVVIRGRLRRGMLFSTVTALTISSLSSYASYCFMRA